MKVWMVLGFNDYDASSPVGVALSEELAQKLADECQVKYTARFGLNVKCHDGHETEEVELDIPWPEGFVLVQTKHGVHWRKKGARS